MAKHSEVETGANRHFCDLLKSLNDADVRYLVVGAHAVACHVDPRFTKDLDIWVEPDAANADRVWSALARFGAPLAGVSPADFADRDSVYQIGIAPNRIDIITDIEAVRFPTAWRSRVRALFHGIPIQVLGRRELIRNKEAVGRPQDLLDVERLRMAGKRRARSRRKRK